jgi:uncharacterized membrane protein
MNSKLILSSAIAGLVALSLANGAVAQEKKAVKEKCFGVAMKEKNDCGTATHSCAGKAKTDYAPDEWKYVAKGTCDDIKKKLMKEGKIKDSMDKKMDKMDKMDKMEKPKS